MAQMQLSVLSEAEIELLHRRTVELLAGVGFKLTHPEALARLARAGAQVDEQREIVRMAPELVAELLAVAPPVAPATGLNGLELAIGGNNRYYTSLILDPYIVDYRDGLRRPCLEDVRRHTIIGDSLTRVNILMRMQYPVSDVPGPDSYLKTMETFLLHTSKHISAYPSSPENCREWMDAAAVIAAAAGLDVQRTPLLSVAMAVTSPLQVHGPNVEIMKMAMERRSPIISTVCPMAGTTSPYSVAGTILQANVESLIPILIAQVYSPGHPAIYGAGPSVTGMRSGSDLYYTADKMLFKVASTQMGAFYGLPVSGEAGGTLTWRPDVQNGAESFAYLLASHVGQQNIIGGLGSLHNAVGMSAEQIVMQCGLVDMAEHLAIGVRMDERRLGYDAIARVGPGGQFLDDDLTLDLLRSGEFFHSPYVDMSGGADPTAPGAYEIAHRTAAELVASYRPTVPAQVQEAIRAFFRERYSDMKTNA